MDKLPEALTDIFIFGSGALPALNYFLSRSETARKWKLFALIFKSIWSGSYTKALKSIERALKMCGQDSIKYILLSKKLSLLSLSGNLDENLYRMLKRSINTLSQRSRSIVLCTLINLEAKGLVPTRQTRLWGLKYLENLPESIFVHINLARRYALQGRLSAAVHHFVKAYKVASKVPHPSGVVSSLNALAWNIREKHPILASKLSEMSVCYLGFFREDPGNLAGALDTLFYVETRLKSCRIYKTAIVISYLPMPDRYRSLKDKASKFSPSFSGSTYKNTRPLRNFLKKILGPYKTEKLSPSRTSEILTGKTSFVRSHTLRKLLEGKDIDPFHCPFPVYNELVKMEIEREFERAIKVIESMSVKERLSLFLSTFTALVDRNKHYLSRKDKLVEAFMLLKRKKDLPAFKDFMSKRYETMLFAIDMMDPHPYVRGRQEAAMKFFKRLSTRKLEVFAKVYSSFQEDGRQVIDRFVRNYGRYETMRLHTRLKGPKVIRNFAKKHGVSVQASFAAYWTEEDGRVRRKIERILKSIASI